MSSHVVIPVLAAFAGKSCALDSIDSSGGN